MFGRQIASSRETPGAFGQRALVSQQQFFQDALVVQDHLENINYHSHVQTHQLFRSVTQIDEREHLIACE
jgi:hypothetical protein